MWAIGRYDFRLTEAGFWRTTPRQMRALGMRLRSERAWLACRLASLVSCWVSKDGQPLAHRNIFPECKDH